MKYALNTSFAVKRWMKPEQQAAMIKDDFGVDVIQFSWDFIDPWWPENLRRKMAEKFRKAYEDKGVKIASTFGGNGAYAFAGMLAPEIEQREAGFEFWKRAIDLTVELGSDVMGQPAGSLNYDDARDPVRREELYRELLTRFRELAAYGKEKGLKEIQVEAVPLFTEIPYDPEGSVRMMKDLEGTDIPIKLLLDWGHALFKPLLKEKADIKLWFNTCAPYVGGIHLQQTDGEWDRHWDFTKEGIVTPQLIKEATAEAGLDDIYQYLEVVTIYEDDDDAVYDRMKRTMDYLHKNLD